jgi:hypothetical protein
MTVDRNITLTLIYVVSEPKLFHEDQREEQVNFELELLENRQSP